MPAPTRAFDGQVAVVQSAASIPTAPRARQGGVRWRRDHRAHRTPAAAPAARAGSSRPASAASTTSTFMLVRLEGGGVDGLGRVRRRQTTRATAPRRVETAWHITAEFLAPLVLGVDVRASARRVPGVPRASAATTWPRRRVEMAAWDLHARQDGQPLARRAGRHARRASRPGVSIGIQDSLEQLVDRVGAELADGYQRIKIKIKPGWDLDAVRGGARALRRVPLMVDANAAYRLADAEHLAGLDAFDLMMIEQPLDYDDIRDHAAAAAAPRDARVPRRVDPLGRGSRATRSTPAPAASSTSSPGRVGGSRRVHPPARPLRQPGHPGLARRDARVRDRARAQPAPVVARRTSRCPATSPRAGATTSPT
ncbi:MAG: hypothetical protein M0C28_13150 [Candidatus Moduliflexus flocculans]|nr:hypothetical protein [Candidatus Moduliflexus flocculans]